MSRTNGEQSLPSIPLSKSEVAGSRDCAGAMEEFSQLQRGSYSAIKVISGKDIIEAVYRPVIKQ